MKNKATEYVRKHLNLRDDEELGLHHWLSVLNEHKVRWVLSEFGIKYGVVSSEGIEYKMLGINFTTGQPATEADYKAFNDITNPKE